MSCGASVGGGDPAGAAITSVRASPCVVTIPGAVAIERAAASPWAAAIPLGMRRARRRARRPSARARARARRAPASAARTRERARTFRTPPVRAHAVRAPIRAARARAAPARGARAQSQRPPFARAQCAPRVREQPERPRACVARARAHGLPGRACAHARERHPSRAESRSDPRPRASAVQIDLTHPCRGRSHAAGGDQMKACGSGWAIPRAWL